jgi:hypothetical protein
LNVILLLHPVIVETQIFIYFISDKMRFSTSSALLALPALGAAADSPFAQYRAQFQNFMGSFGSYLSDVGDKAQTKFEDVKAQATAPVNPMQIFTLNDWKQKVYAPVKPAETKPEEWWVLVTGGNKTCFGKFCRKARVVFVANGLAHLGHCDQIETAFNETAAKFSTVRKAPHMGYLDCDNEPVLCNSWAATAGSLWVFEVLPPPAKTDIYVKRLNLTTTTSKDLLDLYALENKEQFHLHDGYFHPLDGILAQYGLGVPLGYVFWVLSVVPSWAMMLIVSFVSRSLM